jgi:hypothetical protein
LPGGQGGPDAAVRITTCPAAAAQAGLEKTRVKKKKKNQPSGFFWFFWVFLGFLGFLVFFWVILDFFTYSPRRESF